MRMVRCGAQVLAMPSMIYTDDDNSDDDYGSEVNESEDENERQDDDEGDSTDVEPLVRDDVHVPGVEEEPAGIEDDHDESPDFDYDPDAAIEGCGQHVCLSGDFEKGLVFDNIVEFESQARSFARTRGFNINIRNDFKNNAKAFMVLCACAKPQNRNLKPKSTGTVAERNKQTRQRKMSLKNQFKCPMRIPVKPVDNEDLQGPVRITTSELTHTCKPSLRQQKKVVRTQGPRFSQQILAALSALCDPSVRIKTEQVREFLQKHDIAVTRDAKSIRNLIFRVRRSIADGTMIPPTKDLMADLGSTEIYAFFQDAWLRCDGAEDVNPLILTLDSLKNTDSGLPHA